NSKQGTAPAKECPQCQRLIATGYSECPGCGYAFAPPETSPHDGSAAGGGILSGDITVTEYEVRDIIYRVHTKRDADESSPRTLRVDYQLGLDHWQSEFVCVEHPTGYARRKAEAWWRERSPDPFPYSAERAVEIAEAGGVAYTEAITV